MINEPEANIATPPRPSRKGINRDRNRHPEAPPRNTVMKELLRTNELVFLSWAEALLRAEGIEAIVLDGHTSVLEGSTYAIRRRVMIADEDYARARRLMIEAGEERRLPRS